MKNILKLLLLIGTILIASVVISIPFLINNDDDNDDDDDEPEPFCVENPLDSHPVNMTRLYKIFPLGNLNPPGHTYPSDHIYFYPKVPEFAEGFEIYVPGNMTITSINLVNTSWDGGSFFRIFRIQFNVFIFDMRIFPYRQSYGGTGSALRGI